MFQKLEEVIVEVYEILQDKEKGCGWTAYCLFQTKRYRASDKARLKINKRTQISIKQQGSTSALWVQKLKNVLRRSYARLQDRHPQKVPRWANDITWGKAPEWNVTVTRRTSE